MLTITVIAPGTGTGLPRNQAITNDRPRNRFTLAADNSYPTGGYAITPAQLGFASQIDYLDIVNENISAWSASWNKATQKLQFLGMSTGAEVANNTNLAGATCDVIAEGR